MEMRFFNEGTDEDRVKKRFVCKHLAEIPCRTRLTKKCNLQTPKKNAKKNDNTAKLHQFGVTSYHSTQ